MIVPYYLGVIFSSLSLVSLSAVLILFCFVRRRVSNFFVKLGIYLMIADVPMLISAYFDISKTAEPRFICDLTAVFRQYSNLSTMLWNILIVWTVYTTIFNNLSEEHVTLFKRNFFIATLALPLILSIIPIVAGKFIHTSSSCWISSLNSSNTEYLLYDGTYLISFFVTFVIITRYYIKLIAFLSKYTIEEVSGEFYALSIFPIVLIIVNTPDVVERLLVIIIQSEVAARLDLVQIALRHSQVFVNCILFTLNPKVWIALRRYCCRKKRKNKSLLSLQASIDVQHIPDNLSEGSDDSSSNQSSLPDHFVNKNVTRNFTTNPELISKVFDIKSSDQPPAKVMNRRSTNYS